MSQLQRYQYSNESTQTDNSSFENPLVTLARNSNQWCQITHNLSAINAQLVQVNTNLYKIHHSHTNDSLLIANQLNGLSDPIVTIGEVINAQSSIISNSINEAIVRYGDIQEKLHMKFSKLSISEKNVPLVKSKAKEKPIKVNVPQNDLNVPKSVPSLTKSTIPQVPKVNSISNTKNVPDTVSKSKPIKAISIPYEKQECGDAVWDEPTSPSVPTDRFVKKFRTHPYERTPSNFFFNNPHDEHRFKATKHKTKDSSEPIE